MYLRANTDLFFTHDGHLVTSNTLNIEPNSVVLFICAYVVGSIFNASDVNCIKWSKKYGILGQNKGNEIYEHLSSSSIYVSINNEYVSLCIFSLNI